MISAVFVCMITDRPYIML